MDEKYLCVENLAASIEIAPHSIASRPLHANEYSKVVLFGFDAGQEMSEHAAPVPAIMHFLSGEAAVTLGGETKTAAAGTWVWMPANLPHAIAAKTPAVMLLTMFKPAKAKSEQSGSEHGG